MSFLGGLADSFTGAGARRDLDRGAAAVGQGRDQAVGAYQQAGSEAQGYLRPYREQGERAFTTYNDTLGINGTGARDTAQSTYLSDPILQKQLALQQRNRGWSSNARGGYGSGTDALAASRVNQEGYGAWQNRLGQAGQQGQAAAGQSAQIAQQTGSQVGGAYGNYGQQMAGLYGQRAQSENTLAQNLIGAGGVAASYFGGGRPPYATNNLSQRQPYPQQPGYPYAGVQQS